MRNRLPGDCGGFTLVEVVIAIGILTVLSSMAVPIYRDYQEKAKIVRAIAEIRVIEKEITNFKLDNDRVPNSLAEIGRGSLLDPWKNLYQYLNYENAKGKGKEKEEGKVRKDRFLHPLNSDYDLYSMGKDGKSQAPLTAKASHDDIIRADDGGYVGLAYKY